MAGGEAVTVDARLMEFLLYAKELYELTGGEMNVMMGSVLTLWHNARKPRRKIRRTPTFPRKKSSPRQRSTRTSLFWSWTRKTTPSVSRTRLPPSTSARSARVTPPKWRRRRPKLGCESYVLNVGGNIRIIGTRPDGTGWKTGVRDPKNPDSNYCAKLLLADTSCVTSGIYERYFTVDGVRYHHIIDKDTLYPSTLFTSVTVVTKKQRSCRCALHRAFLHAPCRRRGALRKARRCGSALGAPGRRAAYDLRYGGHSRSGRYVRRIAKLKLLHYSKEEMNGKVGF